MRGGKGMSYATVFSPCVNCGRLFGYNPHRVPSILVNGVKEPVCLDCIEAENARRKATMIATGVDLELLPEPHAAAYQPIHESEL